MSLSAPLLLLLLLPPMVETALAQRPILPIRDLREMVADRDYRIAQSHLERFVQREPRNGEAWELLGRCREGRWMFDEAADAYREALELLPETSDLLMRWVNSRARSLNILSAIFKAARLRDAAARALELDPLNIEARGALAAYYEVLPGIVGGDKAKARRLVEELVALSPADGYTLLALQAEQMEEPDSVKVQYLERALEADPTHKGALIQMGLHLIDRESYEEGLQYYERAAMSDPDDPQVWLSYARAYRRMGEADRSAELFGKTLEVDPFFAPARLNLAEYYEADGQDREALRNYTLLAINNPTYESKEVAKRIRRLSR